GRLSRWLVAIADAPGAVPYLYLGGLSLALFVPLLGSFGLWDPYEIRVADVAKAMAHAKSWAIPQGVATGGPKPPLLYWALAAGWRGPRGRRSTSRARARGGRCAT